MASPRLHTLLVVMVVKISAASPLVRTVATKDLKHCGNKMNRVCVTSTTVCGLPLTTVRRDVNLSCYTENLHGEYTTMTCELSLETNPIAPPDVFFTVKDKRKVYHCEYISLKDLNVTAHIKDQRNGEEIRSLAHTRIMVKPPQPLLTVHNTTEDSFAVSWKSSSNWECRLRFCVNSSLHWSQVPDYVSTYQNKLSVYSVKDLLPFTVYKAAVACRDSIWSEWSSNVTVRTRDRVPSRSPEVYYQMEETVSGSFLLHLMWKSLTGPPGSPRALGYQVTYEPLTTHPGDKHIRNVTDLTEILEVVEGWCTVTVRAFNTAGYGPTTRLNINARRQKNLSPVRNLWVSSFFPEQKTLLVQWNLSSDLNPDPQMSHLVMWRSVNHPSTKCLATVDASSTSFVIEGLDLDQSYSISVAPVDQQQCGPPQSLSASLQLGALLEVNGLKVVAVNKTSVTVQWAWQKKSSLGKVGGYRLKLMEMPPKQQMPHVLSLWPGDALHHTFTNLSPYTEYSLHLLADNDSKAINFITTTFNDIQLVVALLLLALCLFIVCILSRTVYKFYFITYISSPRNSASGQWLMAINHQEEILKGRIMDMKDFEVTEKSVIVDRLSTSILRLSSVDLQEDTALLPPCHTVIKSDTEYVSEAWPTTGKPQGYRPDLELNLQQVCRSTSERTETNLSAQLQTEKSYIAFPQKEPNNIQLDLQGSHQAPLQHPGRGPLIYESLFNSSFLGKTVPEAVPGQTVSPPLALETDYIANSCLGVEAVLRMDPEGTTR